MIRLPAAPACLALLLLVLLVGCGEPPPPPIPTTDIVPSTPPADGDPKAPNPPSVLRPPFENETRLATLRQLTFGGQNAEAYWSFDETKLIFQATRGTLKADQIFIMNDDGSDLRMVSTGFGRTTCAYFMPGDSRILYASTHMKERQPAPAPQYVPPYGYVWHVFDSYEIFTARPDGTNVVNLSASPRYDAEATIAPTGDKMVFTSTRDGDLDLYTCNLDGSNVKRVTDAPGYDGGAFFSWDGKKIVWRAPDRSMVDVEETKALLARQMVRPNVLEIWIMDADGSNKKQITSNGAANFGPFWHPDGKRVIFSSNMDSKDGTNFELYLVDVETGDLERVTHFERKREGARRSDDFDGFPMFTRDGTRLVFCSNRFNDIANETNVFVADWVD
jgi:Tol biopolymer transport system component